LPPSPSGLINFLRDLTPATHRPRSFHPFLSFRWRSRKTPPAARFFAPVAFFLVPLEDINFFLKLSSLFDRPPIFPPVVICALAFNHPLSVTSQSSAPFSFIFLHPPVTSLNFPLFVGPTWDYGLGFAGAALFSPKARPPLFPSTPSQIFFSS